MAHGWLVARTKGCSLARVVCQSPPCDLAGRYVYEEEAVRTGTHEHEGRKEGRGWGSQSLNGIILCPDEVKMILSLIGVC